MAECTLARCQQERRAIRKDLQRWTKNMVYILGLERVAEELMGRRKWKLYQDAILSRQTEAEGQTSDDDSMPASEGPLPALKIKTIEQINAPENEEEGVEADTNAERQETILESLIRRPSTHPKVDYVEEPVDWKPPDKCYFCVDGETPGGGAEGRAAGGGTTSPASESDSSSVSEAKTPPAGPPLLQHLLQLHSQGPQALAQFQQMMATLAAISQGFAQTTPQAWPMQRLLQNRQQQERLSTDIGEKVSVSSNSPSMTTEQPLDLSAKSTSSGTPPPDVKLTDNARLKRAVLEGAACNSSRRAYTEEELQSALKDIQTGKLGTRRAAVVYGIPRSTLRNKVYKMASDPNHESDAESDPDRESPPSVILKIPTFPPPDEKSSSPATPVTTPVTPITPLLPHSQPHLNPPLLLPPSVYADPPTNHLFTSLNDVIAKSISQKFNQGPIDRSTLQGDFMRPDRHVSVIKTPPDNQRGFPTPSNSRAQPNNNGQPAAGGKGTRPKRGKYRNYDRDSLVEAVKAVQRGEMSVHRAGSYYGVPHSTLEYKVKERHLMRPRKREPKPQPDLAKPQPPKPTPPKPPTKPFSNGLNGPETPPGYPAGYPFWPPGFAPPSHSSHEMYASHMMRRLREEAPPPANGSFLEGIIRSSLANERPALLQRLTAEPAVPGLLRRLAGETDDGPAARRARLDSTDRQLAAEMREAVQRLRADKLRPRNGTPTPPPAPAPAPPDRA